MGTTRMHARFFAGVALKIDATLCLGYVNYPRDSQSGLIDCM